MDVNVARPSSGSEPQRHGEAQRGPYECGVTSIGCLARRLRQQGCTTRRTGRQCVETLMAPRLLGTRANAIQDRGAA